MLLIETGENSMLMQLNKLLGLAGVAICIHATWLPAKAWLSQQLISASWQQIKNSNMPIKPWPWADTYALAELSFPRLNKHLVILNGGDPTTLAFSAGAVAPFNLPNAHTPFVIAGHRDSHFAFLQEINMKDIISLTDKKGQGQLYQVEDINIVSADKPLPLLPESDNLVLITCFPFSGSGSYSEERYVITAKRL